MKKLYSIIILSLFLSNLLDAQEIAVHNFIGKNLKEVVSNYGKPVYQDKSNPAMICTFYKFSNGDFVFVSDQSGVYQANADAKYNTKESAVSALTSFIGDCLKNGYLVDTLDAQNYKIHKKGCKLEVTYYLKPQTGKPQIKVEAKRSEN